MDRPSVGTGLIGSRFREGKGGRHDG
jgi:hypothetical protein